MIPKKKVLGGEVYCVIDTKFKFKGLRITVTEYITTEGTVIIKDGTVYHPNGTTTKAGDE